MEPFLPQSLSQWLGAIAIIVVWWGTVWKAYSKVSNDVNNIGARVNKHEQDSTRHETQIGAVLLELQRSSDDRGFMRERIASNAKAIDALESELREERMAVMTMLHNNEKAASERDAQTRIELAALRERLNIEKIIHSVVRAMGNREND